MSLGSSSLGSLSLGFVTAGVEMAKLVKINIGPTTAANTFGTWNNLTTFVISDTIPLLDFNTSVDTTWDVTITDAPNGQSTGGVVAPGAGAADWVDEATVSDGTVFVSTIGGNTQAIYRISGLDDSKSYTIKVFPSRSSGGQTRVGEYSVDGFSTFQIVNASFNNTLIAEFTSITSASGIIDVAVRVDAGEDNGYLNAIEIEEGDAVSGSTESIGLLSVIAQAVVTPVVKTIPDN
jgi:hypothetical protein